MPTPGRLKARAVGDLDEARARNKGGEGGYALVVKADSELCIRFLDEPDEWVEFYQHYMEEAEPRAFPCNDGDCVGCDAGNKPSKKWAARVIDVTEGKVRVFVMVRTVWDLLLGRRCFIKYKTILDRNYTIMRTGSTKNDTSYDVDPEDASRINLKKYRAEIDELDVTDFLMTQIPNLAEREEQRSRSRRATARKATRGTATRRRVEEDVDDDDPPFDEEETPRRRPAKKAGGTVARKATSSTRTTARPTVRRRMK